MVRSDKSLNYEKVSTFDKWRAKADEAEAAQELTRTIAADDEYMEAALRELLRLFEGAPALGSQCGSVQGWHHRDGSREAG